MTPRERVLRCLNHQTADRVPLSGSFRPEVWVKLQEHFGVPLENLLAVYETAVDLYAQS